MCDGNQQWVMDRFPHQAMPDTEIDVWKRRVASVRVKRKRGRWAGWNSACFILLWGPIWRADNTCKCSFAKFEMFPPSWKCSLMKEIVWLQWHFLKQEPCWCFFPHTSSFQQMWVPFGQPSCVVLLPVYFITRLAPLGPWVCVIVSDCADARKPHLR